MRTVDSVPFSVLEANGVFYFTLDSSGELVFKAFPVLLSQVVGDVVLVGGGKVLPERSLSHELHHVLLREGNRGAFILRLVLFFIVDHCDGTAYQIVCQDTFATAFCQLWHGDRWFLQGCL